MAKGEPAQLERGKAFHKLIQKEWKETARQIALEKTIKKQCGRRGRIDILVDDDNPEGTAAIVEIKASNWNVMTPENVRRNIRRQIRQVWDYIESQIYKGEYVPDGVNKSISPGIIFPSRPKNRERMKLIEDMFYEEGIVVVWHDESVEEVKNRNKPQ